MTALSEPLSLSSTERPSAALEVRDEGGPCFSLPLFEGRSVLGRAAEADLRLCHQTVSRQHAELFCDPFDRWWVCDLGSRNGVFVNGHPVTESLLEPGDTLRVGKFELVFQMLVRGGAEAADRPADPDLGDAGSDFDGADISTLRELQPPKIDATHLGPLLELGHRLQQLEGHEEGLEALCRLMVTGSFPGLAAVALRLSKTSPTDPPEVLGTPQHRPGVKAGPPYISRSLIRSLRKTDGPVMASNVLADVGVVDLSLAAEAVAMAAVACPLRSGDRFSDALYVTFPPSCATAEWLAIVALAAKEYQNALATAASRKQAQVHAAIERELQRARQIQLRLIPEDVAVPGLEVAIDYRPCHWVAGDYVDVVQTREGRVMLIVADVSGKGLEAALTTSSLHTMAHVSVGAGVGLVDMMQGLNDHLRAFLPEDTFVTMLCGVLDLRSGRFEYVNAGHPPGFILGEGGARRLDFGANLPLGVDAEPFELRTAQLGPAETLALFTDGLTELPDESGRLLGLDALGRHLRWAAAPVAGGALPPCRQVAEKLSALLDTHRGRRAAQDDCSLLLARRV